MVDGRRDAIKRMPSPVQRSKVHGCDRAHQISWKYADADLLVAPVDEGLEDMMSESPQFIGLLGQREIVLIQKILHENDATEEEMKKLFEEERMRKLLTAALQEVRAEILVRLGDTGHEWRQAKRCE